MFGRLRRTPHGLAAHPLFGLAQQVQRGKLSLDQALTRLDSTRELRDLADSQVVELDKGIGELATTNRGFAFVLATLNHAVAKHKGFTRVQVDCALRLADLTYSTTALMSLLREALNASRKAGYRRGEKSALARLGQLYLQEGRPEDAIECYKEQVESARSGGYSAIDVESLLSLGDVYREQDEIDLALDAFEQAVRVAGAAGQPSGQVEALTRAAELHLLRGTAAAALEALERGLVIAAASKEPRTEAELALLLGDLLQELKRPREALVAYRRALGLAAEDAKLQLQALHRIVPVCAEEGHWQETADYARQGLLLSDGQEPRMETTWLLELAVALLELGRPQEAVDAARDALIVAHKIDPGGQLDHDALGRLGTLLAETGDWQGATVALGNALDLSRALGDRAASATWLSHLARSAWYSGDPTGAVDRYRDALDLAREVGDRRLEAHILGSLGTLSREYSQPRRALDYFQEALDISHADSNGAEVVRYLTLLGRTYSDLRQHDDAKRAFAEAIALARRLNETRGEVEAHRRFAAHLKSRRDLEGAMAEISAAGALIVDLDDPRLAALTLQELATVQEELGRLEESAISYRRLLSNAERIDDLSGRLQAHVQLGRLLRSRQPGEAERHLRQALDLARELRDPELVDQLSELLPTGTDTATPSSHSD